MRFGGCCDCGRLLGKGFAARGRYTRLLHGISLVAGNAQCFLLQRQCPALRTDLGDGARRLADSGGLTAQAADESHTVKSRVVEAVHGSLTARLCPEIDKGAVAFGNEKQALNLFGQTLRKVVLEVDD